MSGRSKDRRRAKARQARSSVDPWLGISDDIVRRFIDVLLVEHRYSLYTCAGYRTDVRSLDRWLQRLEWRTLVTATDEQLIRYLSDWTRRHASLRKLPRVLLSLRRFYSFLSDSHIREDNPMLSSAVARWYEQQRPRSVTVWRQQESSRAVAERDRVMLALMIAGGLQAAQLIALRLSDLHLEEGYLLVRGQPTARTVRLSPTLIGMMRQFLLTPRETLLGGRDSAHVFLSCGGRVLTRREFWYAFRRRAESFRALTGRSDAATQSTRQRPGHDASEWSRHDRA